MFDNIRLKDIVRVSQAKSVPCYVLRPLVNMYSDNKIKVKYLGTFSEETNVKKGIRRGD